MKVHLAHPVQMDQMDLPETQAVMVTMESPDGQLNPHQLSQETPDHLESQVMIYKMKEELGF